MKTINRIIMNHTRRNTVRTSNRAVFSAAEAVSLAIAFVGAEREYLRSCNCVKEDAFYKVDITTDWMLYEVYVDCIDREVVGCEPTPVDVWSPDYMENAANTVAKKRAEYLTKYQLVVQ